MKLNILLNSGQTIVHRLENEEQAKQFVAEVSAREHFIAANFWVRTAEIACMWWLDEEEQATNDCKGQNCEAAAQSESAVSAQCY